MKSSLVGRDSPRVRDFALYGETTGDLDQYGLPVRLDWAASYHGQALVVYGHTPVAEARWMHETVNVDTGCVFGGRLSALRWPEREVASVPARREYATSKRPFLPFHFQTPA
jgi:protein phosphatase